jgi:hypothetical protein
MASGSAIGPDSAGHIVACAEQEVAVVWRPGQLADCILMALEQGDWSCLRITKIEGSDDLVDTGCGNDSVAVFVPIMGEALGWRVVWARVDSASS